LQTTLSFLKRRQIGQNKLGVDHFDIANGINRCADVMNIRIFKAADNLHDCVHLSNVMQELIAEAFARVRPFHETSNINELNRRRHDLLRVRYRGEFCQASVRHSHDAHVWVNRTKGIILRRRLVRAGNGVKKR